MGTRGQPEQGDCREPPDGALERGSAERRTVRGDLRFSLESGTADGEDGLADHRHRCDPSPSLNVRHDPFDPVGDEARTPGKSPRGLEERGEAVTGIESRKHFSADRFDPPDRLLVAQHIRGRNSAESSVPDSVSAGRALQALPPIPHQSAAILDEHVPEPRSRSHLGPMGCFHKPGSLTIEPPQLVHGQGRSECCGPTHAKPTPDRDLRLERHGGGRLEPLENARDGRDRRRLPVEQNRSAGGRADGRRGPVGGREADPQGCLLVPRHENRRDTPGGGGRDGHEDNPDAGERGRPGQSLLDSTDVNGIGPSLRRERHSDRHNDVIARIYEVLVAEHTVHAGDALIGVLLKGDVEGVGAPEH